MIYSITTLTGFICWDNNNNNNNTYKTMLCSQVIFFHKAIPNFPQPIWTLNITLWDQAFLVVLPYILTFYLLFHAWGELINYGLGHT